jgi:hypothetical protein
MVKKSIGNNDGAVALIFRQIYGDLKRIRFNFIRPTSNNIVLSADWQEQAILANNSILKAKINGLV